MFCFFHYVTANIRQSKTLPPLTYKLYTKERKDVEWYGQRVCVCKWVTGRKKVKCEDVCVNDKNKATNRVNMCLCRC